MNQDNADARWRAWMRDNLSRAADHFGLAVRGVPIFGWLDRSIGARAERDGTGYWLRVVSEDPRWVDRDFWTGNLDANRVVGVPKPEVLDVTEWVEWRRQRAEVMTLLPGEPCSPTDVLRGSVDLSSEWWAGLRQSLARLRETTTSRLNVDQDRVDERIRDAFGSAGQCPDSAVGDRAR